MRWRLKDGLAIHVEGYNDYDRLAISIQIRTEKVWTGETQMHRGSVNALFAKVALQPHWIRDLGIAHDLLTTQACPNRRIQGRINLDLPRFLSKPS